MDKHSNNYECDFLQTPDEGLMCQICYDVAAQPHITTCCKKLFCYTCLHRVKSSAHPHCPWCRQTSYGIQPSETDNAAIQSLPVYCTVRGSGCGWTGPLQDLARTHLSALDGSCMFVTIPCPDGCGQQLPRGVLQDHKRTCPKRQFACPHCHQVGTFEYTMAVHSALCTMYPMPCPNGCGVGNVERRQLDHHLDRCPLALVRCPVPGCGEVMERSRLPRHGEEHTQRHLALLSSAVTTLLQEREQDGRQASLQQQQMESVHDRMRQLEQRVNDQHGPPVDFIMSDYDRHRRDEDWWSSPAFKTHFRGYSMYLAVQVRSQPGQTPRNENEEGHISMEIRVNDDASNDHLVWPQWCTVKIEVLNQLGDRGHHVHIARGEVRRPELPSSRCWAEEHFMPCSELGYCPHRNTQYLKDDCLRIRVGEVRMQDGDFLYDA